MTCIGNSGPLPDAVVEAIEREDLVCCSVLSGNRNFEGRVHPNTRANYLASPLLVVAYAIAGINITFTQRRKEDKNINVTQALSTLISRTSRLELARMVIPFSLKTFTRHVAKFKPSRGSTSSQPCSRKCTPRSNREVCRGTSSSAQKHPYILGTHNLLTSRSRHSLTMSRKRSRR